MCVCYNILPFEAHSKYSARVQVDISWHVDTNQVSKIYLLIMHLFVSFALFYCLYFESKLSLGPKRPLLISKFVHSHSGTASLLATSLMWAQTQAVASGNKQDDDESMWLMAATLTLVVSRKSKVFHSVLRRRFTVLFHKHKSVRS